MTRVELFVVTAVLMLLVSGSVHADANHDEVSRAAGVRFSAGLGAGTRGFVQPTAAGVQRLSTSPFAAAALELALRIMPRRRFGLDVLLAYDSSFAWLIEQAPLFAPAQALAVRSQHVELSCAPVVRFGDALHAPALAFPLGLALRSFWPQLRQFPVHAYNLGGLLLRAELSLPLGQRVRVRAGPELQWLVIATGDVTSRGLRNAQGFALGAEAMIEAEIDDIWRVALSYRESRARMPSAGSALEDTERYLTLRVAAEL